MQQTDTICAISTPPGVGGIAVARVAGPQAIAIADTVWHGRPLADTPTHTARVGQVTDTDGSTLDQAVATVYRGPHSFTGDDIVEFAVHGSRYVQRQLLATLVKAGCRIADPGEFTRRAFMAGKLDLAQAEAVADVIASSSRAAHRIAVSQLAGGFSKRLEAMRQQLVDLASLLELELDFSEEDVEFASRQRLETLANELLAEITRLIQSFTGGQAIKDGIPVAIVGAPNVGKSSLLNRLLGDDRAIVSDIPGTTRDTVEETAEIGEYLFRFIDTAGLRDTADPVEQIGIARTRRASNRASIILDLSAPGTPSQLHTVDTGTETRVIHILNKADLLAAPQSETSGKPGATAHPIDSPTDQSVQPGNPRDNDPSSLTDTPVLTDPPVQPTGPGDISASPSSRTAVGVTMISAKTGTGLDTLRQALVTTASALTGNADSESAIITNARHAAALTAAADSAHRVVDGLRYGLPPDLVAQDLRQTIDHLATITGAVTSSDILSTIFSRFCVGK